jgi:hypothetical protein
LPLIIEAIKRSIFSRSVASFALPISARRRRKIHSADQDRDCAGQGAGDDEGWLNARARSEEIFVRLGLPLDANLDKAKK